MRMIFVNLPVKDLAATKAYFAALGFSYNPQFSDDNAACMIIEENISVMFLQHDYFRTFINGEIADPANGVEVLNALSCDSREAVDDMVAKAVAGGGKHWRPAADHGWMYTWSFQDLNGHVWELMHADPAAIPT